MYLDNLYVQLLSLLQFSVSVVSQFVRDMKRSDHVSLCTTTPSSITSSNNSSNNGGKKLRKRRELNAMAAPHVIVRSSQQSNNSSNRSGNNKKSDYKSIYFSNSSSNNNEDDGLCSFLHLFPYISAVLTFISWENYFDYYFNGTWQHDAYWLFYFKHSSMDFFLRCGYGGLSFDV